MKIKYVGPARDFSGYGEAARHDIAALLDGRIQVTSKIPSYVAELSDFGSLGERVLETENKPMGYEVVILHTTPNVYRQYMEAGKYHIARVFWETDKLPMDFAINVQACDEVWTGSEFNKRAIENAGVTKPIYIIPEAVDADVAVEAVKPYKVKNESSYKFYSIFEWTERKNPKALLEAFWTEFGERDNVSLTIKTYLDNFSRDKRQEIDHHVRMVKKRLNLKYYAPVYLYRNLMDRQQVYRFHQTFDCFVSAHRGEGWGIPQMEALLMNKPVISTNCGGIHEYLKHEEDALLIPYKLIPLKENTRNTNWYTQDQQWAEVDINELRNAMRACYQSKTKASEMGISGGKAVRDKFSLQTVGALMRERLLTIDTTILHPTKPA